MHIIARQVFESLLLLCDGRPQLPTSHLFLLSFHFPYSLKQCDSSIPDSSSSIFFFFFTINMSGFHPTYVNFVRFKTNIEWTGHGSMGSDGTEVVMKLQ